MHISNMIIIVMFIKLDEQVLGPRNHEQSIGCNYTETVANLHFLNILPQLYHAPRAGTGPLHANRHHLLFFCLIVSDFAQQIKQGDAFGGVETCDGFFADEIGLWIHLL